MKLSILGKQRKGKKSFELISDDDFGFNIECFDGAGAVTFNNIQRIEWLNEGANVYLNPPPIEYEISYIFNRYTTVIIRKAKKLEKEKLISRLGDPMLITETDKSMKLNSEDENGGFEFKITKCSVPQIQITTHIDGDWDQSTYFNTNGLALKKIRDMINKVIKLNGWE